MTGMRAMRAAGLFVLLLAVLAGCGQMPGPAPTLPPATLPAGETGTASAGTPASGQTTLGDLAVRVNAAWPAVRSYRVTFTGGTAVLPPALASPVARPPATPGATPMARPRETGVSVREVVLPDRQRQQVTGLGAGDHEAVATGENLYVRGPLVQQIAPGAPPEVWVAIDPSTLPDGALLSRLLGGLPQAPGAPLASLPERLWPQSVRDLGAVEYDGRVCRVYGAADTVAATGRRIDYSIAIDDRDRPCFIETSVGGVTQGRDEYTDIDAELIIEIPAMATPVSIPPALATPASRD